MDIKTPKQSPAPYRKVAAQVRPSTNIHAYPVSYLPIDPTTFFEESPAALYAHIPFCTKKCHFCNFAVTTTHNDDVRERYVRALVQEIKSAPDKLPMPRSTFQSINIGGGTPALLESEQLARILDAFRETYPVAADAEIGVEFDPATVNPAKARELVDVGFSRFSVGVQSFEDEVLARANRDHDATRALEALATLTSGEINDKVFVNLDLIFPLPGLSGNSFLEGVDLAAGLDVDAVTLYGLEIWPKTVFHHWRSRGELPLPERLDELKFHLQALDVLRSHGYRPGAASAWLSPRTTAPYSSYLDTVWSGSPVLGFGVSSRSTVGHRSWNNVSSIARYLDVIHGGGAPVDSGCKRTPGQSMRQHVIRGFKRGYVDPAAFELEFGERLDSVFPTQLEAVANAGLISESDGILELTDHGRVLIPNIVHIFVEADEREAAPSSLVGVAFDIQSEGQ
ncbi:coproporphyrinogen-III oxidase family protein [Streptomyces sp. NPDC047081]|uniref:coproporphyrinogen-III oxidase family protein n=1 Tax=Streptomyces sp. NPDC047081 TaxID=3154706 RepID=UPI0033E21733